MYKLYIWRVINADVWYMQTGVSLHVLVTEGKYLIPWVGDESLKIDSSVRLIDSKF